MKSRWKPRIGEQYFTVGERSVKTFKWQDDFVDHECYNSYNCYQYSEDAAYELEVTKLWRSLRCFANDWNTNNPITTTYMLKGVTFNDSDGVTQAISYFGDALNLLD